MLKEVSRLHALGLALHWLRPKSKAPIENSWTKGPRKTLTELKAAYKPGMNLGVRLGEASKIGKADYLAVIDCDVKSTEEKHLKEMEAKLAALFGDGLLETASVASGRGNGSRHYYIRTSVPVTPLRLAQSFDHVKVLMPSVKASKRDAERLKSLELTEGYRMRAAWEISLMGEGQQVVLPPSIHPDSGKQYVWRKALTGNDCLLFVETSLLQSGPKTRKSDNFVTDVKFEEVDLTFSGLSGKIIRLIQDGEGGSGDGSAELMSAMIAMHSCGLTKGQILSVLTDRANYLGNVAYKRSSDGSRAKAAAWVYKYGYEKAREKALGLDAFDMAVEIAPLTPEKAEIQAAEINAEVELDWTYQIERNKNDNRPKHSLKNLVLILEHATEGQCFSRNMFSFRETYAANTPWGGKKDEEIQDIDSINIKQWCAENYRFEPSVNLISEAVLFLTYRNPFHPVKEWLESLPAWDGENRIDTWMKRLLGATGPEPYLSAVSRKILVAMIARVFEPGTKFDYMPILIGDQGVMKSTSISVLASPWGSDAKMSIDDKDGVLALAGTWIMEFGEMSGLRKAEVDQIKEFITRATDRIRLPYGRRVAAFPRQCVFIGSTNQKEFLSDETGNRRFWPVTVGLCDPKGIEKEREQLFAEARIVYQLGEKLYLNKTEEEGAKVEQEKRMISDVLEETLSDFLAKKHEDFNPEKFRINELFSDRFLGLNFKDDWATQRRVGRALKRLGYEKHVVRDHDKNKRKFWVKGVLPH